MPIYEYQCQSCNQELEVLQKISDSPLQNCPQCGEPALKKKISAAAFRLKGGGWYETDFKTGSKKNLAGDSEKSGASSTASDQGGKSSAGESKKSDGGESKKADAGAAKKTA